MLVPLWYCTCCTRLILPSNPTYMNSTGTRLCAECAPAELKDPAATAVIKSPPSTQKRATVRTASARVSPPKVIGQARDSVRSSPPRPSHKLFWAGTVAFVAMLLLVAGIFIKGGSNSNQQARAETRPVPQPQPQPKQNIAPAPVDKSMHPADSKASTNPSGGLFANMKPGLPFAATPAAEVAALKIDEFNAAFEPYSSLLEKQRFSEAAALLDNLNMKFSKAPWWETKKDSLVQARETLQRRYAEYEQSARDAAAQAAAASTLAAIEQLEKTWAPKTALGDMSAKAAAGVVDAARRSRERLARAESERFAALAVSLDKIEKRLKPKLARGEADAAVKALQDFKVHLGDAATAAKFSDRIAGLNVDIRLARGPEKLLYNLEPCPNDNCELKFDFAHPEQESAWKLEGEIPESGAFQVDSKKKTLFLNSTGRHLFDAAGNGGVPALSLPFYFSNASWSLDSEMRITKSREHDRDKKELNPAFGIFVSDGAANILRFSVKESSRGMLQLGLNGSGVEASKDKPARIAGKQEDKIRLRMECRNGSVGFGVTVANHPATSGRAKIGFEPKFVGIFLETHDAEENASLAVTSFKLNGEWDKNRLNAAVEAKREAERAALKSELFNPSPLPPGEVRRER